MCGRRDDIVDSAWRGRFGRGASPLVGADADENKEKTRNDAASDRGSLVTHHSGVVHVQHLNPFGKLAHSNWVPPP